MASHDLPIASGVVSQVLHPLNVFTAAYAVLSRTLQSFNPSTLVIRRVRRSGSSKSRHHRHSHRTGVTTVTEDDATSVGSRSVVSQRREPRHRHRTSRSSRTAISSSSSVAASAATDGGGGRRSQRRSRSAEAKASSPTAAAEKASAAAAAGQRSRSDNSSSHHHHHGGGALDGLTSSRAESDGSMMASGEYSATTHPSLPPPPPLALGKPPLSGRCSGERLSRRESGSVDGAAAVGGGASERHRSRHTRERSTRDGVTANGEGPVHSSSSKPEGGQRDAEKVGWWQRLAKLDVTKFSYVLAHLLRAAPVSCLHSICTLERQIATLPMLCFRDAGARAKCALIGFLPQRGQELIDDELGIHFADASRAVTFLVVRTMLTAVGRYVEDALFLDSSFVARNLRSRRLSRRIVGWTLRLTSHALVDTVLMSIVTPLLCTRMQHHTTLEGSSLCFTVSGLLRGLLNGLASSIVQCVVLPLFSQLASRAAITVLEAGEYVVFRRYAAWTAEHSDGDTSTDGDDDDGGASRISGQSSRVASADVSGVEDAVSNAAEARALRRRVRRQRRERRAAREHQNILRSIGYRVCGALVARCLVEHPLGVFAELLRGRAVLYITGMLRNYDSIPPGCHLTLPDVRRTFSPGRVLAETRARSSPEDDGVPSVVLVLRGVGEEVGHEVAMISTALSDTAGQTTVMEELAHRVSAAGGNPTARDGVELLVCTVRSLSPLFYGVQFSILDKLLGFYLAVGMRLAKQQ